MADNNKKIVFTVEVLDKGKIKIDGIKSSFSALEEKVRSATSATKQFSKTNVDMIATSGLAGATLTEVGRTISDFNYGIRGIANNLSQLSSLFITLVAKAGTFGKAISVLKAQLMGPLGLILVFQTIVMLLERYSMQSEKAADSSRNFAVELRGYVEVLNDANSSESARANALQEVDKQLGNVLDSEGKSKISLEELSLAVEHYIDQQLIRLEIDALIAKNQELFSKRRKRDSALAQLEAEEDAEKQKEIFMQSSSWLDILSDFSVDEGGVGLFGRLFGKDEDIDFVKVFKRQTQDMVDDADSAFSEIVELQKKLDPENRKKSGRGSSRSRSRREFLAGQLDFEKEIIKSQGRISESLIVNNQLRVKEEFETIRELAVLKQKDFAEAQQRKVDLIKDEKLKAAAQKKVNKEIADSEKSLVDYIIQLREERDRNINQMRIDDLSNASSLMEKEQGIRKKSAAEFNSFLALTNKQRFDADIELEKLKTEIIIQELEQQIEEKIIAGESTIGLEEKIDALREKLFQNQIERGVKFIDEEAKRINGIIKATQGAFAQLSNVFTSYTDARIEALARERDYVLNSETLTGEAQKKRIEDIQRRELQAQKNKIRLERELFTIKQSMLIAEQVMKANAIIMENKLKIANDMREVGSAAITQASKAKMSIGTFVAKDGLKGLAAYAITIGGLLASIFAARKKAQSQLASLGGPSGGSMGGAGGGPSVEAPDFNVVGASPESQLAQSVSEQQTQPLRAFVVHKDIKDANELDRNIDVTRTLG